MGPTFEGFGARQRRRAFERQTLTITRPVPAATESRAFARARQYLPRAVQAAHARTGGTRDTAPGWAAVALALALALALRRGR